MPLEPYSPSDNELQRAESSITRGDIYLQVEFRYRQACTRFVKFMNKGMPGYIETKAERCVWLKMHNPTTRNAVRDILLKQVSKCELRYREGGRIKKDGCDYLYVN